MTPGLIIPLSILAFWLALVAWGLIDARRFMGTWRGL